MAVDPRAQLDRQHLGAEAKAEKRLVFLERDGQPFDFAAQPKIAVVGAHRAAEHHHAVMLGKAAGKVFAERRAADVEFDAGALQQPPDPPRTRMDLMQYYKRLPPLDRP